MSSPDPWYALLYFPTPLALLIPPYLATLIQEVAFIQLYIGTPFGLTISHYATSVIQERYLSTDSYIDISLSLSGPILN
jgi:hypothetical protein